MTKLSFALVQSELNKLQRENASLTPIVTKTIPYLESDGKKFHFKVGAPLNPLEIPKNFDAVILLRMYGDSDPLASFLSV